MAAFNATRILWSVGFGGGEMKPTLNRIDGTVFWCSSLLVLAEWLGCVSLPAPYRLVSAETREAFVGLYPPAVIVMLIFGLFSAFWLVWGSVLGSVLMYRILRLRGSIAYAAMPCLLATSFLWLLSIGNLLDGSEGKARSTARLSVVLLMSIGPASWVLKRPTSAGR